MTIDLPTRFLMAIDRVRLAEARVARAEASLLAEARRRSWHEALGYARFGDFAREVLGMAPRSAWDLVALDRLLTGSDLLEGVYLAGELSACQVLALGPLLREGGDGSACGDHGISVDSASTCLDSEQLSEWIELARRLTVRELVARVRAARNALVSAAAAVGLKAVVGASPDDAELDDLTDCVRFEAPPIVRAVLDETFELASRMLGRRAARWECLEAALIEAAPECAGAGLVEAAPERGEADLVDVVPACNEAKLADRRAALPGSGSPVMADGSADAGGATLEGATPPPDLGHPAVARALATLDLVTRELDGLDELIDGTPVSSADELVVRLQALRSVRRPLRSLLSRLLRDLRGSGALDALGNGRLGPFMERHLMLSPRTARYLAAEARLFEDRPDLETAWCHGRIGIAAALDIARVAPFRRSGQWIARAESITARQFHREVVFRERLGLFAPEVARRHGLPFPVARLEVDLWEALERRAACREEIVADLAARGFGAADLPGGAPVEVPGGATTEGLSRTTDPAEDPRLMRRLEAMLDHLILSSSDDARSGLASLTAGAGNIGPGLSDRLMERQTFAHGGIRREWRTRIRLTVPRLVGAHWYAAIESLRLEFGPIPIWLAATILFARAARTWQAVDPDALPTEWRVLDRDEYGCQAPGCSARAQLEVHHVIPRARLGSNDAWNTVTLCHAHHHHGVHAGHIRVSGRAPGALRWSLGRRQNGGALQMFRGERRVVGGTRHPE